MRIARSVTIERPIDEVFAFVADARNDPRWCRKVRSVDQVAGDGPGPGARYVVLHRPMLTQRRMHYDCVAAEPPSRIVWVEDDGTDRIEVTYELDRAGGARTRLTQIDDARLGVPRLLQPLLRVGIGVDLARQLRALKRVLEQDG